MAIGNTLINSLKIMLMSTGALFIAILLSLSLPQLLGSASIDIPSLWFGIQAWLRPPYLYFIINGIIITIVATSRLHHHHHAPGGGESAHHASLGPKGGPHDHHQHDVIAVRADQFSPYDAVKSLTEVINSAGSYYGVVSVKDVVDVDVEVVGSEKRERRVVEKVKVEKELLYEIPEAEESGSTGVERSTWTAAMTPLPALARQKPVEVSPEIASERPPASARFSHHRRPAKVNSAEGGKALRRVAKPKKKQDTLETTWKAITEGRHIPLTRHLKKSDTWENQGRQIDLLDDSFPDPPVKKSETFKDRTNHTASPVPKLKKDPSLGQDELNRRVEAFINKFNADMKLQREQSIQQFMDKINRAAY